MAADSTKRQYRRRPALVVLGAVLLLGAAGPAGAQGTEITAGDVAAADVAARIVAGELVELKGTRIRGDLILPRSTRISAPLRCRGCHFTGSFRAPEATFERGLDLEESVVDGDLDLSGTSFEDWANLDGARIGGPTLLRGARFSEALSARDARFGGSVAFDRARVKGQVAFTRASFGDAATFTGTAFGARADFGQSKYAAGARFDDVVFAGAPSFALGEFGSRASFNGVEFRSGGSFQFAHFADVSLERAVAAGPLALDGAVVDGEASFDGLTSTGEVSLDGVHVRPGSLFVEQLAVEELTMDVGLVSAIRGRAAQKHMLERLESTAKAREDLSTANDARFHRLSMMGEEKDGAAGLVDDGNRLLAGYLVRPVRPVASFLGLVGAASLVRLGIRTFPGRRVDKTEPGTASASHDRARNTLRASDQHGRARIRVRPKELWDGAVYLWTAFWKAVADGFQSVADSLGVAFRIRPDVAKPEEGRIGSYAIAIGRWMEYSMYKIMLAVMVLTIGNANPTVRELLESVRP